MESTPSQTASPKRSTLRKLGWIPLAIMLLVFVGDRILNGQRGENYHRLLLAERAAITPLANSSVVSTTDHFSPWNSHKALVGTQYMTRVTFSEIADFYHQELQSKGWYLVEDRSLTEWGKDYGGDIKPTARANWRPHLSTAAKPIMAGRTLWIFRGACMPAIDEV